jgi:hypothetical protein
MPTRFKLANAPPLWDLVLPVRGEKKSIGLRVTRTKVRGLVGRRRLWVIESFVSSISTFWCARRYQWKYAATEVNG